MARARNIKPSLFKNEDLGTADPYLTVLFVGLWCLADREGRLEDRPLRIGAEIFPYRGFTPDVINGYLTQLVALGFIRRYEVGSERVIQVVKFAKHQSPHSTEKQSELPPEPLITQEVIELTVNPPLNNDGLTQAQRSDSLLLIPDSLTPESPLTAKPASPGATEINVGLILSGVKKELGLKKFSLSESRDWSNYAFLALENEFTPTDFLECLSLMRRQKWRKGICTPDQVHKNLSNLHNLRAEIAEQANGKPKSEREKSAERGVNAVAVINELRRQGRAEQALSSGVNGLGTAHPLALESAKSD